MILVPTHEPSVRLNISEANLLNGLEILREIWCEDVYRAHPKLNGSTRVVVDAGASFGAFTALAMHMAPQCRVVSIEPQPRNLGMLRANIDRMPNPGRVTVVPVAVSGEPGSARISDDHGGSVLGEEGDLVDVLTLADVLWRARSKIDVLKVDIEGHEFPAINSIPRDVMTSVGYIAAEFNNVPDNLGQLVDKLSETHRVSVLGSHDRGGYVYAEVY